MYFATGEIQAEIYRRPSETVDRPLASRLVLASLKVAFGSADLPFTLPRLYSENDSEMDHYSDSKSGLFLP